MLLINVPELLLPGDPGLTGTVQARFLNHDRAQLTPPGVSFGVPPGLTTTFGTFAGSMTILLTKSSYLAAAKDRLGRMAIAFAYR
jgi:hypothetical protein